MHVLVVSQYYPPEAGATQNRLETFVKGLLDLSHQVTVVCQQPNHPAGVFHEGFGRRPVKTERHGALTIHRLWVVTSPKKSTRLRIAYYGTFAAGALATCSVVPRPDVVFTSSPPLPGAYAAALAARARKIPLVTDVRDIWPAAAEALGELSNPRVIRGLERIERSVYAWSSAVTATTAPFCRHIDGIAGRELSVHLPNGALDELIALPDRPRDPGPVYTVGYAGNLGIAQGLEIVLDAARELPADRFRFVLVGAGPDCERLRTIRDQGGLEHVDFRPEIPTSQVGDFLQECDALLVPLRDRELLADFIPSKLYDAMAVGRPVITALRGEGARLVEETGCGIVVPPEDGSALAGAVRRLADDPGLARRLGAAGKAASVRFGRSAQVTRLEQVLQDAVDAGARVDAL